MSMDRDLRSLVASLNDEERGRLLHLLRGDFGIPLHPIEMSWNTTAEAILEAIYAAPDLTQRGVRGILAEATFRTTVVPQILPHWRSIPFHGEQSYDLLLRDQTGDIKVQVKNQRREAGLAKVDNRLSRQLGLPVYVVETQRTRNGKAQASDGEATATRPYRFGEFDVLAVCLQPSTGRWTDFIYCASRRLLPRPEAADQLKVLQPIFTNGLGGWSYSFDEAAKEARL